MVGLIMVMTIWPHVAEYCVDAMGYVTTAFVAVRLGYSAKGAVENFMKIKSNIMTKKAEEQEETLG